MDSSGTANMINAEMLPKDSVPRVSLKSIQYQIMMDIFDTNYGVKIKELIFPVYSENELINGHMVYFLDEYC